MEGHTAIPDGGFKVTEIRIMMLCAVVTTIATVALLLLALVSV
jgi:hypothetical protein